jgi:3-deoxy-D-manno-octulosonate 8-phosphate phosphatase (KDO 8-P phosphatase)
MNLEEMYSAIGGTLITHHSILQQKLAGVRAFIFDWDGVFNNGTKQVTGGSNFSEVDSMGCSLLRYSWFLKHGILPPTAMISGERNPTSYFFSERESFAHCYYKVPHKLFAFRHFCEAEKLHASQVAYFFDDVLDIPVAEQCGVRIMVNQKINPIFLQYCLERKLVDYLTSASGGGFAVREGAELLIALNGNYDEVISGRTGNNKSYQDYVAARRAVKTIFYTLKDGEIEETEKPG